MAATLETRGLAKRFGSTVAVDDLTMNVYPGRVTGFVGPNGAGKTTTMHLLLGLSAPTGGEALVAGKKYASLKRPLTVLVSSHLMTELEGTADQLIVIGRGRLLADMSVADLVATASGDRVEIRTGDVPAAMTTLSNAGATTTSVGSGRVIVEGLAASGVSAALAAAGVSLEELSSDRGTLEDAYFRLTRQSADHSATPIGAEASES